MTDYQRALRDAAKELLTLKRIKDYMDSYTNQNDSTVVGMRVNYQRRKSLAWQALRDAVDSTSAAQEEPTYCQRCGMPDYYDGERTCCGNPPAASVEATADVGVEAWAEASTLPEPNVQVLCTGLCRDVDPVTEDAVVTERRWYAIAQHNGYGQWKPEKHGATDGIDDLYTPTHWMSIPSLSAQPSAEPKLKDPIDAPQK